MTGARPPVRAAAATALGVLAVYLLTLAPTVTFWDAGELIAAARTLGIPHPPGTPLFVLIAHVWGVVFPFGDYAWRLNLFSAVCGAAASGCWFLVAHDAARRMAGTDGGAASERLALGAGFSAALLTALNWTTWQNSTETEVYSIAMLLVALVAWIAMRWRMVRGEGPSNRLLLLALYLGGMSIGNHLLALLVGPALVAVLVTEAWRHPLADGPDRRREWARIGVVATIWLLLIALGLGSTALTLAAGMLALVAAGHAIRTRQLPFALTAMLIVIVGASTYLFLFLRARQGPWINEADPSTWQALLGVIRRAQYPVRTPLDDPMVPHGSGNPGRTLTILGFQLANYVQYFDWQWAKSIGPTVPASVWRALVTVLFAVIGVFGAVRQRRVDRSGFAFVAVLFLVTGLGLLLYIDFKPGSSIGWDRWPALDDHEVRERDYFFVASFVAWAVWVAIGTAEIARRAVRRAGVGRWSPGYLVFAVALVPLVLNFRAATRRHTAEETFARDFARALLQSVPPGGILFTFGDNDTFPLWHAQAVDGVRRDVTVVCLALAETPWYQKQLRGVVSEPVDREQLAAVWRDAPGPAITWPVHTMDNATIDRLQPFLAEQDLVVALPNGLEARVNRNEAVYGKDVLALQVLRQNAGRRPVAWSVTAAGRVFGLGPHLVMQGLALVLPITPIDTARLAGGMTRGAGTALVDIETTRRLVTETWRYGRLLELGIADLDPNGQAMAATVAIPLMQAGAAYYLRGDMTTATALLERASRLTSDSTPQVLLRVIRGRTARPRQ